jgi:hypothetical protein
MRITVLIATTHNRTNPKRLYPRLGFNPVTLIGVLCTAHGGFFRQGVTLYLYSQDAGKDVRR